jgi:DeoR family transcriptional regulator, fructose operon transcriptional repressor
VGFKRLKLILVFRVHLLVGAVMQHDRRSKIANMVSEKGSVKVEELVKKFEKSQMTIHRDLNYLEEQGILKKSRGGAIANPSSSEVKYTFRRNKCQQEKREISRSVCSLIEDGDTIMIDGSTTAIEMAVQLKSSDKHITVFTHSPLIIHELMNSPNIVLYSIGTFFSREMMHLIGVDVEEQIKNLNFSKGIFGVSAIMKDGSLADPYPQLASIKERIIASSAVSIVLADHTKYGKIAVQTFANIKDVDYIISDSNLDEGIAEKIREKTNVIIAESENRKDRPPYKEKRNIKSKSTNK